MTLHRDDELDSQFQVLFSQSAQHQTFASHTVDFIGDSSGISGGHLMSIASTFGTRVLLAKRNDLFVNVVFFASREKSYQIALHSLSCSSDSPQLEVIMQVLRQIVRLQPDIVGCDLLIDTVLPQCFDTSVSPSLAVAVFKGVCQLQNIHMLALHVAQLSYFAAAHVREVTHGLPAYLLSSLANSNEVCLLDIQNLIVESFAFPLSHQLLLITLHPSPPDAKGLEIEFDVVSIAALCQKNQLAYLSDMTLFRLNSMASTIEKELLEQARYLISENNRTLSCADAFHYKDMNKIKHLMAQSQQSLTDLVTPVMLSTERLLNHIQQLYSEDVGIKVCTNGAASQLLTILPLALVDEFTMAMNHFCQVLNWESPEIIPLINEHCKLTESQQKQFA